MNAEKKLEKFINKHKLDAKLIRFNESVKTVQNALKASGLELTDIIKTIIFKSEKGPVAAVVTSKYRVSSTKLKKFLGFDVEIASPEETLKLTGYPAGGVPCIGHDSIMVVDPFVFQKEYVYSGGGSSNTLMKLNTKHIKSQNPIITRIRK